MIDIILNYWLNFALTAIGGLLIYAVKLIHKKFKENDYKQECLENGLLAILHDRLFQMCNYHLSKGYIPTKDAEDILGNAETIYKAYHELGGNGTGTLVYEALKKLPIKDELLDQR